MDIINSLVDNDQKVNEEIINIGIINDSKYEDISDIRQKLEAFGAEINSKSQSVKAKLKEKNEEIRKQKTNKENPLHDAVKANYIDKEIDECQITNELVNIYNDINLNYKLSRLNLNEAKDYIKQEFGKIKNLYDFFCSVEKDDAKKNLEDDYKNVIEVDNIVNIDGSQVIINGSINSLKNLQNLIFDLSLTYKNNYNERVNKAKEINDKLCMKFVFTAVSRNYVSKIDETKTYYNYEHSEKLADDKFEINTDIINDRSVDDLKAIEGNIKNLENDVNVAKNAFEDKINETCKFFKEVYGVISDDIKNYKLVTKSLEEMINSINRLYELVKTNVSNLIQKANNISNSGVCITSKLKERLKEYKLYDDSDDIKSISVKFLEFSRYFNDKNENGNEIKVNLENLQKEIKKSDLTEQIKKIYDRLKKAVNCYIYNYKDSHHILSMRSIKKNEKGHYVLDNPFCFISKDKLSICEDIKNFEENCFYKIEFPGEIKDVKFENIENYLDNFEKIFNHNAKILKKIKDYLGENIKKIKALGINYSSCFNDEEISKYVTRFLNLKLDDYFDNYIDFKKFIIADKENFKGLQDLYKIFLNSLYELEGKFYLLSLDIYFGAKEQDINPDNEEDKKNIIDLQYVLQNVEIFKYFVYNLYIHDGAKKVEKSKFQEIIDKNSVLHMNNYFKKLKKEDSKDKTVKDIDFYSYTHIINETNKGILLNVEKKIGKMSDNFHCLIFNEFYKYMTENEEEFFKCGFLNKDDLKYKSVSKSKKKSKKSKSDDDDSDSSSDSD